MNLMKRLIEKQYFLRRNMLVIIGLCLSIYFSYHLIAGHRGYVRLMSLENQIASAQLNQEALIAERAAIEKKVVMMRPGTIDRDLLEERVRFVLGYRAANEINLQQNSL